LKDNVFFSSAYHHVCSAREVLRISTFKIERSTSPQSRNLSMLLDAIIAEARVGLNVQLLIHWSPQKKGTPSTNIKVMREFQSAGVDVRFVVSRVCHAKLIIVDSEIVLIGSHNLSTKSFTENFEVSVETDAVNVVSSAITSFDAVFVKAKKLHQIS
jgi:phosphatidylserine/phosphatidylglycerophosphate/cardiolipin synthase-like enzyme